MMMELKDAFDLIDATLGMFRSFANEIENGDHKEKFLMTPVYTSVENVFDANKNISEEVYSIVDEAIRGNVAHIHLGLSNYAIKKLVEYIESKAGSDVSLSCINNSHMCCGEGICGACTVNVDSRKIVHLCKEQMDVYDYGKLLR